MYGAGRDRSLESSSSATAPKSTSRRLGMWLSLKTPRYFKCSVCQRSFPSLQALGGHQNAHRKERNDMYRHYMAEMEKIGQSSALTPSTMNASSSLMQSARANYDAAAFEQTQFQVQTPSQVTYHQFLPPKIVDVVHQNPYGLSLGNCNFQVPCVQPKPSFFDELSRGKRPAIANGGSKALNLFPNNDFHVNAGSFADGADENEEVTSEPLDLNLRLSGLGSYMQTHP